MQALRNPMYRIGVDVGGTFTDFSILAEDSGAVRHFKVPSTPHDPSEAIQEGVGKLLEICDIAGDHISHLGHGTTVATNMIIERRGTPTGLLTTKGFRDVLEIGRQIRPHLYDYNVRKPEPLVPREQRLEVDERVDAEGNVLRPLDEAQLTQGVGQLKDAGLTSIAVCFLHAYKAPDHERLARAAIERLMPDAYVSLSSEVLPEFREFERLSTTVINAYVGPRMEAYLERFLMRVRDLGITVEPTGATASRPPSPRGLRGPSGLGASFRSPRSRSPRVRRLRGSGCWISTTTRPVVGFSAPLDASSLETCDWSRALWISAPSRQASATRSQ